MPRKQNGFGKPTGFKDGFDNNRVDKAKRKVPPSGQYPSNRSFGTTVTRSNYQQWNIESSWQKWRRGYEYARQGVWNELDLNFKIDMFGGTTDALPMSFTCTRFPGGENDTAIRYVTSRIPDTHSSFATVASVLNNPLASDNKTPMANYELYVQISNSGYNPLIRKFRGVRITNKEISAAFGYSATHAATVKEVLNLNKMPARYKGMSSGKTTVVKYYVPKTEIDQTSFVINNGGDPRSLIGQIVIPYDQSSFFQISAPSDTYDFKDYDRHWTVEAEINTTCSIKIIEDDEKNSETIFSETNEGVILSKRSNTSVGIHDTWKFLKDPYQKYYPGRYIGASLIEQNVTESSMVIPPLYIANIVESGSNYEIWTIQHESEFDLFNDAAGGYLVFNTKSFASTTRKNSNSVAVSLDTDPYLDETFVTGDNLYISREYSCNCPSHSNAVVRSPELLYRKYDATKSVLKKNRQYYYPLPSSANTRDPQDRSNTLYSGVVSKWKTATQNVSLPICKHSIAGLFATRNPGEDENAGIYVEEPNNYPTYEGRQSFEKKLAIEFKNKSFIKYEQLSRSDLTNVDLSWSLIQLLGMSEQELGEILGNSETSSIPFIEVTRINQSLPIIDLD